MSQIKGECKSEFLNDEKIMTFKSETKMWVNTITKFQLHMLFSFQIIAIFERSYTVISQSGRCHCDIVMPNYMTTGNWKSF